MTTQDQSLLYATGDGLEPCPTLASIDERTGAPHLKHDHDLRDTCVMPFDLADEVVSICDVTGYSYQSSQTIQQRDSRNAARGDAAIRPAGGIPFEGEIGMSYSLDALARETVEACKRGPA